MTLPWIQKAELDVTSLTTSMNLSAVALVAPYAAHITAVQYVPNSTQAGGIDVNHRMLSLYNRGSVAGTGTTRVATLDLTSAAAGGTLTNNVPSSLTLTATTAFLTVAAGDVLEWESSMSATGMNDPGGRVIVTYSRI